MPQKKTIVSRQLTWTGESTESTISYKEMLLMMKKYGAEKAKTVRSSRKYLRSLGLVLNRNGEIIDFKG